MPLTRSFSQAQSRMDSRRNLVTREANAIRATWLRAGHLDAAARQPFQHILIDCTTTWLQGYEILQATPSDRQATYQGTLSRVRNDEQRMWAIALRAENAQPGNLGLSLLTQQLTTLFDASAEQAQALTGHIPTSVILVMISLVTLGANIAGLSLRSGEESTASAQRHLYRSKCRRDQHGCRLRSTGHRPDYPQRKSDKVAAATDDRSAHAVTPRVMGASP